VAQGRSDNGPAFTREICLSKGSKGNEAKKIGDQVKYSQCLSRNYGQCFFASVS
jgi:hypothetical protein